MLPCSRIYLDSTVFKRHQIIHGAVYGLTLLHHHLFHKVAHLCGSRLRISFQLLNQCGVLLISRLLNLVRLICLVIYSSIRFLSRLSLRNGLRLLYTVRLRWLCRNRIRLVILGYIIYCAYTHRSHLPFL